MTTEQLESWLAWRRLLKTPVADLPLADRIRRKLHWTADTVEDLLEAQRRGRLDHSDLDDDEYAAVQQLLPAILNHPGSAVQPLGKRPGP